MSQTSRQRWRTRASDAGARWIVTGGGLLTIGSLALMFVLIVRESLPLFAKGEARAIGTVRVAPGSVLAAGLDESRTLLELAERSGVIRAVDAKTGAAVAEARPASADGLPFAAAAL